MGQTRFDFTGETVVVTGGTSGIGRTVAETFRAAGAHVVITGTHRAEHYGASIAGFDYRRFELGIVPSPARLTAGESADGGAGSAATVFAGLDRCDVLVNCAGTMRRVPSELTGDAFAATIAENLAGTFRVCEAAHPLLARRGGSVINLTSMTALFGSPRVPGYASSKGGLISLTRSLAQAWAPVGIRVNVLAPGFIETPLIAAQLADDARRGQILARTPLGRIGTPSDVAGAAMFLASAAAAFITGALLPVDGGYSAA